MPIKLFPHQQLAINQLRSGSILCGGVGSGKSIASLAYYFVKECGGTIDGAYKPMQNPRDLYIITTARKRDTHEWEGECAPFLLSPAPDIGPVRVVIDSWNNIGKYTSVAGAFFIFDEQRVVGSGAWVKGFLSITKKNKWLLLSATPGDTWMDYIPVFVANGFYKNRTEFIRRHVIYNRFAKYPKVDRYVDCGRLISIRRQLVVNMKYIKPTARHVETVWIEYNKILYDQIINRRWNVFENKPIKNVSELFYLMRKVVNSDPTRVAAVAELIKNNPKTIVFYNFNYELELLRSLCDELEVEYSEWNGHKHQPLPKTGNWVYLVQYTAGAEGWNCITTNTIIFYSQNYSYKIMEQASGRIDRLNTPFADLYYYHIKSNSTIDIAIDKALSTKRNFNESTFTKHFPVET